MKSFPRSDRVSGQVQKTMAELLRKEIKDPRLSAVTITGVRMSRDLRIAKIYFTAPNDEKTRTEALAGFERARGFVKRELAQRLGLRYMPDLKFFYDASIDYGEHIEKLLKAVKQDDVEHR